MTPPSRRPSSGDWLGVADRVVPQTEPRRRPAAVVSGVSRSASPPHPRPEPAASPEPRPVRVDGNATADAADDMLASALGLEPSTPPLDHLDGDEPVAVRTSVSDFQVDGFILLVFVCVRALPSTPARFRLACRQCL